MTFQIEPFKSATFLEIPVGSKDHTTLPNASEDRLRCVLPRGHNVVANVFLQLKLMAESI